MRISQGAGLRGGLMRRFLGSVAVALALTGCGGSIERPPPSFPWRVVCGTPAVAEIVFALGCGDRVVGVSDFTDWPPEAAEKPRIGGALAPNRERILRLEPDLILAQGQAEALEGVAHSQNVAFLTVPLDTLEDLQAAIAGFAAALGAEEQGQALLAEMESDLSAFRTCGPVSVFIALGHTPGDLSSMMTSGGGTFLDQMVAQAGGSNIFSDVRTHWPEISQETLIRRNPALILDFQTGPLDDARRAVVLADWERLGFQAGRIRILPGDDLLKPGIRAVQSAARIAAAICSQEATH